MKPADAFQRRFRGSSVLQSWCRACIAVYNAERHQRLHDREMERIRRNQKIYVARNVELLREYLASHPCVDCGESDPIVLDFDHLRDKEYDVSKMVHNGYPWARILKEIAKCEVRCSNDHRRATHRRRLALKSFGEDPGRWSSAIYSDQWVLKKNSEPDRNRTCDPDVRSVVLYPLSYGLAVHSSGW